MTAAFWLSPKYNQSLIAAMELFTDLTETCLLITAKLTFFTKQDPRSAWLDRYFPLINTFVYFAEAKERIPVLIFYS